MEIDDYDRRIIKVLAAEGRISNLDLAERIGLSPTPTARRVKRLEDAGIIRGYSAVIDTAKLGQGFIVMVAVHFDNHNADIFEEFIRRIRLRPEVLEAYMITGIYECILRVATRDLQDYSDFQRQHLLSIPHVIRVDSMFVLQKVKPEV
ncbi:MAG: Lrp/AsnC family transcriptional regulator [Sphingomonadales bacterium]|nr:Lrp/AsnC family transcriptional regulator [Sphingomonadales bacterium]